LTFFMFAFPLCVALAFPTTVWYGLYSRSSRGAYNFLSSPRKTVLSIPIAGRLSLAFGKCELCDSLNLRYLSFLSLAR